jgi:hypothetical protein
VQHLAEPFVQHHSLSAEPSPVWRLCNAVADSVLCAVQHLAELIVQNYSLSAAGLTTYAETPELEGGYQEGRPDVSELFEQQSLASTADPGLCPPSGPMLIKLEARSVLLYSARERRGCSEGGQQGSAAQRGTLRSNREHGRRTHQGAGRSQLLQRCSCAGPCSAAL